MLVVALRHLASRGSFPVHLRVFLFPSCFREPASYNSIVFLILQYILWETHLYRCLNLQLTEKSVSLPVEAFRFALFPDSCPPIPEKKLRI